jgi:hypothetical protein
MVSSAQHGWLDTAYGIGKSDTPDKAFRPASLKLN